MSGNVVGTNRANGFLIQAPGRQATGQKAKSTIRVGGAVATTDAGAVTITACADIDLAVAGGVTATRGTGIVAVDLSFTGTIATTGAGANAIVVAASGPVRVTSTGAVSVGGNGSAAVDAHGALVSVDLTNLSVSGARGHGARGL